MKHTIKYVIIYSLSLLAFCSCASMGKIAIQVAIPPKNTISPDIQTIVILNRAVIADFDRLQQDSVDQSLFENKTILYAYELNIDTTFFDSAAADTAITVAAKAIYDSQRFDVVVPLDHNILRDDKGGILLPLDKTQIDDLCNNFNVDGVLVLESFSERVKRDIYSWESNSFKTLFTGIIDLTYKLDWRFYQPGQNHQVLSFMDSDSIFWESDHACQSLKLAFNELPAIKEAFIGGGIASGLNMADLICPKWVDETRFYYITGDKNIDSAIPLTKINKWDEAAEIWMKYSSVTSKSLRSKIEYNLALAAEMSGDLDHAIEWGIKSLKTKYSWNADDYLMNLSRRSLNQSRYYYTTGNPEIDAAVSMIKQHKWDEAAEIWMKYYSVNDKILKSKIEYNLALTEEMKGNIDLALKWGAKSLESNNSLNTKQYVRELRQLSRLNRVVNNSNHRSSSSPWATEPSMIPWTLEGRED